jgi:hypothetical protein
MLGVTSGTAEEFYGRCLANAQTLGTAAQRRASERDSLGALADAWGADVYMLQAMMWERIIAAASSPQRQFFRVAEAIVTGLRSPLGEGDRPATLGMCIAKARERMAVSFDDELALEMVRRWPDITYLDSVPAVGDEEVAASVQARLLGLSAREFVSRRRTEAAAAMLEAQTHRVRGETSAAIQSAYQGDFTALDAYLVESAVAAGDNALLTVTIRWDLAVQAVQELPGLPDDFSAAIAVIRSAIAVGIGEADGRRLVASLVPA